MAFRDSLRDKVKSEKKEVDDKFEEIETQLGKLGSDLEKSVSSTSPPRPSRNKKADIHNIHFRLSRTVSSIPTR